MEKMRYMIYEFVVNNEKNEVKTNWIISLMNKKEDYRRSILCDVRHKKIYK